MYIFIHHDAVTLVMSKIIFFFKFLSLFFLLTWNHGQVKLFCRTNITANLSNSGSCIINLLIYSNYESWCSNSAMLKDIKMYASMSENNLEAICRANASQTVSNVYCVRDDLFIVMLHLDGWYPAKHTYFWIGYITVYMKMILYGRMLLDHHTY